MKKPSACPKKPYISRCLDMSTTHITEEDDKILLSTHLDNPLVYSKLNHGYLIPITNIDTIPTTKKKLSEYGYSKEFINLIISARKLKCEYLLIDADGTSYPDLPSFEW